MELDVGLTNLVAIAAIALGLAVGGWFVIALYWLHSRQQEDELPEIDLPGRLHEVFAGIPVALTLFYLMTASFSVGYILYIYLKGISY
jgi:hypothetical protein